jgi:hypothetical protein
MRWVLAIDFHEPLGLLCKLATLTDIHGAGNIQRSYLAAEISDCEINMNTSICA